MIDTTYFLLLAIHGLQTLDFDVVDSHLINMSHQDH